MNPMLKEYMIGHWVQDTNEKNKMLEEHAKIICSFVNPQIYNDVYGDNGPKYSSSDEEFDRISAAILNNSPKEESKVAGKKYKRKKKIKVQ